MTGIDIIEIARIEKSIQNENFLNSVFTKNELLYYEALGNKTETLAGMFCCKEAVAKAMGTGFKGFRPNDIEVLHKTNGAPFIKLYRNADDIFSKEFTGLQISVSISHNETMATAICLFI